MGKAVFTRQNVWCGIGMALVIITVMLYITKPWMAPAEMNGWQERGDELQALFHGDVSTAQPAQPVAKHTVKPTQSAQPTQPKSSALPSSPKPAVPGKLNLNKATLVELDRLPGIGPAKAQAIIDYREKTGAFAKPEDIRKVKGIGEKLYESIKNEIVTE